MSAAVCTWGEESDACIGIPTGTDEPVFLSNLLLLSGCLEFDESDGCSSGVPFNAEPDVATCHACLLLDGLLCCTALS